MQRVLVAGATGETGRRVVQRFTGMGVCVRVLSRSASRARERLGGDIEVHEGDVREPDSLVGLASGVEATVSTIGTRSYFGANGGRAVDASGTANLLTALAQEPDRPHVVLLSAFGLERRSIWLSLFSAALNGYFRWKRAAERVVRDSGLPYTIVRPVELRNRPPRSEPRLNQEAPLSLLRTVSREVVADVLVLCAGNPLAVGKTFELCEGGSGTVEEQLKAMRVDAERPIAPRTPLF